MAYGAGVQRLVLAVLGGLAVALAFPTTSLWGLAPVGLALIGLATCGAGWAHGGTLGYVAGLAVFLPTLSWAGIYVGTLPWLALSGLQAVAVAGVGALHGGLTGARPGVARVRPVVLAVSWVVAESLRGRLPYGGFPWVLLGTSQADSPFGRLAPVAGTAGIGFAVAVCGGLLGYAVQARGRGRTSLAALVTAAAALLAGLVVPLPVDGPMVSVLGVQGNVPRPGLDFNAERRAVLDNHVRATMAAADEVAAGTRAHPDLVVWPENSSDIDPTRNPDADAAIRQSVDRIGAPVIVGTLTDDGTVLHNVSFTYAPGEGVVAQYVKQHPVPFAEYIPDRAFWRRLSSAVDLLPRDYSPGEGRGIVTASTASGATVRAGLSICFEVAYADLVRDVVTHGANLLVVQTNNATFGYTAESEQQLAVSRIRAMEFGRSVVHVSTVGVSALVTPDGTPHLTTSLFTTALLSGVLPLRDDLTLAARLGQWPELLAAALLLGLAAAHTAGWRGGLRRSGGQRHTGSKEGSHADDR